MRPSGAEGRRWLRWALRTVAGAVVVVAAVGLALAVLLGHLDSPLVKQRVQALVRSNAGVEIDYATTRFHPLSGVLVEGLVVRSPPEFRSQAPELLRVGRLEVAWSPVALLRRGGRLDRVSAEDVAITVAVDGRGRSSLDLLRQAPGKGQPEAAGPASSSSPTEPPVDRIDLSGVELTWMRVEAGQVQDRFVLGGLALQAEVLREGNGWGLATRIGSAAEPVALLLTRDGAASPHGFARLALWLEGRGGPSGATASLDLRVREQTLVPRVTVHELLRLDLAVSLDAARATTEIALRRARLADGAASLEAMLSLPDATGAAPLVREASGVVDLERLLAAAPPGLLPLTGRGHLSWNAREIEIGDGPRILPGGSVEAEGDLADLRLKLDDVAAAAGGARISLRVNPAPGGAVAKGSLGLRKLGVTSPGSEVGVDDLELELDASRDGAGAWTGAARIGLGSLRLTQASGERAELSGVRFGLQLPPAGGPPFAATGSLSARDLRVTGADGRLRGSAPVSIDWKVTQAFPDSERPAASRAIVALSARVGALVASLDARKHAESIDFSFTATGQELPGGIGLALNGSGHAAAILSRNPSLRQRTEVRLDGPGLSRVHARQLTLAVNSSGDLRRHHVEANLGFTPLADLPPWHASLSTEIDGTTPGLQFQLVAEGGPTGTLSGSARLDGPARAIRWDADGKLAGLSAIRPFLSGFPVLSRARLSRLELGLSGRGTVSGIVSEDEGSGRLRLVKEPMRNAEIDGVIDLHAKGLRWQESEHQVDMPSVVGHVEVKTKGQQHGFQGQVQIEELHLLSGARRIDGTGIAGRISGGLARSGSGGEGDLVLDLSARSVKQDLAPYPVGSVDLQLSARRTAEGVVRISNLRLENAAGGTVLTLQGGVDRGTLKRRLSLQGELQQDVARVWSDPETFEGRGRLDVTFRVESPDFTIFRTQAAVRLGDIHARFPQRGVSIESLDGEIPISADVASDSDGLTLLRRSEANPFSTYRVADQHPFLSRSSFIAAQGVKTPMVSIAAMAGNLRVEQNFISFTQFEMEMRGGQVTGEWVLDWNGLDSVLRARVRATGVESSQGEPFDGSASFVVSAAERGVDGRIDILRIGSNHLRDMLDLQDPQRLDPATNRIRFALNFGHPDGVRVELRHGFARMKVTLGGLASLLTIGDLRGIPTGPIIDKALAPFMKREDR